MSRGGPPTETVAKRLSTATPVRIALGHPFQVLGNETVVQAADTAFIGFDLEQSSSGGAHPVIHEYRVAEGDDGDFTVDGAGETTRSSTLGGCLDLVQWHINQRVVDRLADDQTGLHAAAAACDDGVVLLPGTSGSGKSTMVAGLVRNGWRYLTDEVAVLENRTLEVTPYPKPISLDDGTWSLFPDATAGLRSRETCLVPAHRLGDSASRGGPVSLIVAPLYRTGSDTSVEPLTPAELLMLLAQSTFLFNQAGPRHLSTLARLARQTPGYRLVTGDLATAIQTVEDLMPRRTR